MPPFTLPPSSWWDFTDSEGMLGASYLERGLGLESGSLHYLKSRDISSSVLTGHDPTTVDPSNPIILFIIQLIIIIVFTQGLGWLFRYIRQPAVIAEVIGGVILGPTVMGRIPNFTAHIFPQSSLTYLNLVANIGLILFLFLIGLEVDISIMRKNGQAAAAVSLAGMIVPFGIGAACAIPTYNNFVDTSRVTFGHFLLFVGVAMAITAFPVLCRILTSTKLLDTRVGLIVLAAGVGNDVVGWVLLALTLALVNSGNGVTAVYMLLLATAWTIIMLWPVKKGFNWLVRKTGSLDHGPTPIMMNVTLVIVFISSFFTGIIGVHPIFGAFIAGLIIPHEGGFAISLVEKIDDLVAMLFLPIYFVLSGLSTNLGLLNNGKDWGYIIMFIVIGWFGKFAGCAVVAKFLGYSYRESGAIGMLMSCKGLVELIVLNVGYNAGIIDQRLFSMFVVVAVVLTFVTTPFTLWIYPVKYHERATGPPKRGKKDKELKAGGLATPSGPGGRENTERFLVVLQKIEHLSAVMFITQMLEPAHKPISAPTTSDSALVKATADKHVPSDGDLSSLSQKSSPPTRSGTPLPPALSGDHHAAGEHHKEGLKIDALKLIELTGRTFSVMQSAEKDQLLLTDDALQLFKQFGRLRGFEITPHLDILTNDSYPQAVSNMVSTLDIELVLLPWTIPVVNGSSNLLIDPNNTRLQTALNGSSSLSMGSTPFESIFGVDSHGSPMYTHFVRRVFSECPSDIALFVDRGFGAIGNFTPGKGQHIFLPFFGGPDDRLALRFVVQLCRHEGVSATVVRIEKDGNEVDGDKEDHGVKAHKEALANNQITLHPNGNAANKVFSETADNLAWAYYTISDTTRRIPSLSRITFHSLKSSSPLTSTLNNAEVTASTTQGHNLWRPLLVVTGRSRRNSPLDHSNELNRILSEKGRDPNVGAELRKTVGDVATSLILGGGKSSQASFLVLESGAGKTVVN